MIDIEELTPLDAAKIRALEFSGGLACLWHVQQLVEKDADAKIAIKARTLPNEIRSQAIKDMRDTNLQLQVVAEARALCGISA